MKILSIGNSFSQDAQTYLHEIAKGAGVELHSENLMIGGCSLEHHHDCLTKKSDEYVLEVNGVSTERHITIQEALSKDEWDAVTLQQVSQLSPDYGTYMPYLKELSDAVKEAQPRAKQVIHQTWAYEDDSERLTVELGFKTSEEMFLRLEESYNRAADEIGAEQIPSGLAFDMARARGIGPMHRDTFHAQIPQGRYLLGAIWLEFFTGTNASRSGFLPDGMTKDEKAVFDALAHEAIVKKANK